jgi:signal transduction histidine kinase
MATKAVVSSDGAPRQEHVLSEISHELGNYFHKLYYWGELLREQRLASAAAEPAALLERTIRDLETFLKTALEFFRPISIVPMAMSVDELTAAIRASITRQVDPTPVCWNDANGDGTAIVAIDPGRFSFILEAIVRRVLGPEVGSLVADVATQGDASGGRYALTLTGRSGERPATQSVGAVIEWAIVERVVELHGGSVDVIGAGAERGIQLHLPIRC